MVSYIFYFATEPGNVSSVYETTIEPNDMARAIAFAINEPSNVAVNELIVRPTNQEW